MWSTPLASVLGVTLGGDGSPELEPTEVILAVVMVDCPRRYASTYVEERHESVCDEDGEERLITERQSFGA